VHVKKQEQLTTEVPEKAVKRGKERDKSNPALVRLEVCFLVLPKILVFGM
jgi:hypothetical protein